MTDSELIWRIAGGSGDGIDSTSQNFAKVLMRSGLDVFTHRHYPSRIRGGHPYVEIRARAGEARSRGNRSPSGTLTTRPTGRPRPICPTATADAAFAVSVRTTRSRRFDVGAARRRWKRTDERAVDSPSS